MTTDIRSRFFTLIALALLGVGLAGAGTAIGVMESISDSRANTEFVVSDHNMKFLNSDQETIVLNNLTKVDRVEIQRVKMGHFRVNTETENQLSEKDHKRAKEIALANETVRQHLDTMDEYELSIKPIYTLDAVSTNQVSDGVNVTGRNIVESGHEPPENATVVTHDDSVVINRTPSYVEDEVIIRVSNPTEDELRFTIRVDLGESSVVGLTDRENVSSSSSSEVIDSNSTS